MVTLDPAIFSFKPASPWQSLKDVAEAANASPKIPAIPGRGARALPASGHPARHPQVGPVMIERIRRPDAWAAIEPACTADRLPGATCRGLRAHHRPTRALDRIGIDVHKRESQIYILAEGGEVIDRRIRTAGERFAAVLGSRPHARIPD
jgi:hypothetical protein